MSSGETALTVVVSVDDVERAVVSIDNWFATMRTLASDGMWSRMATTRRHLLDAIAATKNGRRTPS